jgi:transposase
MTKTKNQAANNDVVEVARLLRIGRNRYDNELLKIEQIWAKLKPQDYARRASIIKAATGMIEIDKNLKVWEDKLNA